MSAPTCSGWADSRFCDAFQMLDDILAELHPEHDAHSLIKTARDAVEDADVAIERSGR